jgi:hypothetical protein
MQISKFFSRGGSLPTSRQAPSEEKVKTLIIGSHCEEWSDEAILKINYEFLILNKF